MPTVKVIKTFGLGDKILTPGMRNVPEDKIARLVKKGFVEAPSGEAAPEEPASAGAEDSGRVDAAVSRIGAAVGFERNEGESAADYLERLADEAEARKGVGDVDSLPSHFPHRELLAAGGITTRAQLSDATDKQLVDLDGIGDVRVKEIRKAEKALK